MLRRTINYLREQLSFGSREFYGGLALLVLVVGIRAAAYYTEELLPGEDAPPPVLELVATFDEPEDHALRQQADSAAKPIAEQKNTKKPTDAAPKRKIQINAADSAAFIELPGIGPVFAGRIVRYREALGGFYAVEQLAEVKGIRKSYLPEIYKQVELGQVPHRRIHLNQATEEQLVQHPYFAPHAHTIVGLRQQRGTLSLPDDLLLLPRVKPEELEKMMHYTHLEQYP